MSATKGYPSTLAFPPPPSSSNPGDHEMRDFHDIDNGPPPPPVPNTAPLITPYLGLRARLSQVWINRWTVLLLLVLVRLLLAVRSLDDKLGSARREALSACTGVESMGSAMASMPHYMSQGVNELTATGVERAVNGLMSMLMLSVTGIEEIVVFIVNLLTSTYVCLITLAISGSLHVALEVVRDVGDFLNKTLGDVGSEIQQDLKSFQDDLNEFANVLNSVPKFLGSDSTIPTLQLDGPLDKLDNLQIPTGFNDELDKLNASIPTFAEVQNFTNGVLRTPFEQVKRLMNETMVAYKFDRSVFPVPAKEQLSFCSDNDGINDFFDKLIALADKGQKIFIGLLLTLAILACIPMAYREIWRWSTMQKRARLVHRGDFDPVDILQISSRPYTSTAGIKAASWFGSSTRRQILIRWLVAYVTSTPALFLISLGLAGLFACLCHYILLKAVEKETPALANQVGAFAGKVVNVLNNASEQWALGTNRVIESTNREINDEVFGWVNTTTGAVNDTLNAFVDQMSEALNTTFGGTVLYDPIKEVLNCLIGLKIAGIQRGLTWVSENANVEFPLLANDTFSLGAVASISADSDDAGDSFLADPTSKATDKITNTVAKMTEKIEDSIRTEALISTCLLLVWVLVCFIGLFRVLFLSCCTRDKTRGEGGDDHKAPSPPRPIVYTGKTPRQDETQGRTRHSSFFFPHAFRTGPNSAESPEEEYCPPPNSQPHQQGQYGPGVNGANGSEEKVGFAGLRTVVLDRAYDGSNTRGGYHHGQNQQHHQQQPPMIRKSSYGIVSEKNDGGGVI